MKKIRLILFSLILIAIISLSNTVNAQFTNILDFTGTANGRFPYGDLYSDGTFLYGMTNSGGTNGEGTIFKVKPDGTGYAALLQFDETNGNSPQGTLISDGTFLYGMTPHGGPTLNTQVGIIFKIKPDGTGFAVVLDLAASGAGYGQNPYGSLIYDGTFLYGMTSGGGVNFKGTIFKVKPDGTGYSKLLDFAGATNGQYPEGSLVSDGTFLYGMTNGGGANSLGVIFKIMPDGSGYTKLLDFTGTANGNSPKGSLIYDGTFLYGMTPSGGTSSSGTIFKIMPDGSGYAKLLDFDGANGKGPKGSLVSDGTFLYGITEQGGANSMGVIFKIKPDGTGFAKLLDLGGAVKASYSVGSLITDGTFLYGMARNGGISSVGTVFKFKEGGVTGMAKIADIGQTTVFPNPSSGKFEIFRASNVPVQLKVTDLLGKEVYFENFSSGNHTIDLNHLQNGIYMLHTDNAAPGKLIIQK